MAIALILSAAWSIGEKVLRSWPAVLIGMGALVAGVSQLNTVWVLLAAGIAGCCFPMEATPNPSPPAGNAAASDAIKSLSIALPDAVPRFAIVTTFIKIGLVSLGGGSVLVPVLHNRLVTQLGWLKPQEFLDGLAISNLPRASSSARRFLLGRSALISWHGHALFIVSFCLLAGLR